MGFSPLKIWVAFPGESQPCAVALPILLYMLGILCLYLCLDLSTSSYVDYVIFGVCKCFLLL